jgi:hypothetical protein
MAVAGVVAGMVLLSTAMATGTRPTGLCTATTGLTGATGIGITKQMLGICTLAALLMALRLSVSNATANYAFLGRP